MPPPAKPEYTSYGAQCWRMETSVEAELRQLRERVKELEEQLAKERARCQNPT